MGYALTVELTLETHTCGGCGSTFGVDSTRYHRFAKQGESLRCPNPRCPWPSFSIKETEADRLRKQLLAETARADRAAEARRWAEESAEREKRRHAATKGVLTRERKRVGNGVCPCCNRSFQNLRRHMQSKHPEFHGEPAEEVT